MAENGAVFGPVIRHDRRNITDEEIANIILAIDEREKRGGNRNLAGTNQFTEVKSSLEPLTKNINESATCTAAIAGTSPSKVKKLRYFADHAPPEILEAVKANESGETSGKHWGMSVTEQSQGRHR